MNIINNKGKIDFNLLKEVINALYIGKGIMVLDSMCVKNWNILNDFLKKVDNVSAFSLKNHSERKIVLRYVMPGKRNDYKKIHELAIYNYEQCNFDVAKILFKRLLSYGMPDYKSYAKLGMCYLQLGNYTKASECLLVADDMGVSATGKHLYMEYIYKIDNSIKNNNNLSVKTMSLGIDVINHYGICNLSDIFNLVSGTNIDLCSACLIFGLTYEELLIVKLILAQQCYQNNLEDYGDVLLTQVEKSETNNKKVLALLEKTFEFKENKPEKIPARIRVKLNNNNVGDFTDEKSLSKLFE